MYHGMKGPENNFQIHSAINDPCQAIFSIFILAYLAYVGTYLGAPNMVKWGVPEKILQNAVQTC